MPIKPIPTPVADRPARKPAFRDRTGHRSARRGIALVGAAIFLFAEIGCATRNSVPEVTSVAYQGPPLVLNREARTATVVMSAPSPGWRVGVDRIDEGFHRRDIFLTIQPPDPAVQYAQVVVEQRVATTVVADVTARLFARTIRPDGADASGVAYSRVLVSDPVQDQTDAEKASGSGSDSGSN